MKTTGLIFAAAAATAAAENLTLNLREVETSHVHAEFEDLGYRCAHTGGDEDAEIAFYQVSTGESLFQMTSSDSVHTMQYLDHEPIMVKNVKGTKSQKMLEQHTSGTMQARVAGHEALHAHPVFSKYVQMLSASLGEQGIQGNTHPAAVYLHHTAMANMKRTNNTHKLAKVGVQQVPSNLNGLVKGDEFAFDSTSASFLQELMGEDEEWGGVGGFISGVANGIWGAVTGIVNGIIGGITTVWDAVTNFLSNTWGAITDMITSIGQLPYVLGKMPIGIVAKAVWYEVFGGGRRRRRRRFKINGGVAYRPFFDNANHLWSRLGRCPMGTKPMNNAHSPLQLGGSPCFGICGPGCICFIWHCGTCLRNVGACFEHDCACMDECSPETAIGSSASSESGKKVAWDAYICWLFTANLSTCGGPGCCVSYCGDDDGNNHDHDGMTEDGWNDGDCRWVAFHIQNTSGDIQHPDASFVTPTGASFNNNKLQNSRFNGGKANVYQSPSRPNGYYKSYVNVPTANVGWSAGFVRPSEYYVTGVNFPKRQPGGMQCWGGNHAPTPQNAWVGGGAFTSPSDGQADMCYTTLGKTAMIAETDIDNLKPYGQFFHPQQGDLAALGYNIGAVLGGVYQTPVSWPGCGIDASRLALNYAGATGASNCPPGTNDPERCYNQGGTINYRAANIGQYPPTHALGIVGYAEGASGSGCFGLNSPLASSNKPGGSTPTRQPTQENGGSPNLSNPYIDHTADFVEGEGENTSGSSGGSSGGGGCNGNAGNYLQVSEGFGKGGSGNSQQNHVLSDGC